MKVHFFSPNLALSPSRTVTELFADCGNNSGNLLFINAVHRQIRFTEATFGYEFDAAKINAEYELVVIPAANWINEELDLGVFFERLKDVRIKIIVIGLGAQAKDKDSIPKLPHGSRLFLDFVSENSSFISTRGKFSTEVLNYYGYNNCVTTGCPSIFLNCSPVPNEIHLNTEHPKGSVVLQGTRHDIPNHEFYKDGPAIRQREFIQYALRGNYDYIIQSEFEEIYYALNRLNNQQILANINDSLQRYYDAPIADQLGTYLTEKMHFFYSLEEWISFIQAKSLVVSTRIHGAIMALHAGVQGMLLWHDSRTQEIAEHAGLPAMPFSDYDLSQDPGQVLHHMDYGPYRARYPITYQIYKGFLESNGVIHNLQ